MTTASTNKNLVLTFAHQQICVQLRAKDVVFYIPNVDGSMMEFQTKRSLLRNLKSKLSCKDKHVRLSLMAKEGNELVLECLDSKTANQYRHDIDAAKQLLAKPYWSRAAAKTFTLGASFGVLAVVASAFWLVSNKFPMAATSQASTDWQSQAQQTPPTTSKKVEDLATHRETSPAEEWQP